MSNTFVEQRMRLDTGNQLASVVGTLPRELRDTNAAPLLAILRELEASSVIELGVISAVTRVDPESDSEIKAQRTILEDYRDRRLHDRDRTHCSNIRRILTQVRSHAEGPGGSDRIGVVDTVLAQILGSDKELLDDIESILDRAVATIAAMDGATVDEAERVQSDFAADMGPVRRDIKANLGRLNALTAELIDAL
jgi:hypothetical protein